ncbi:hypothetical protein TorRG33x02_219810, partial [Trema orientale]
KCSGMTIWILTRALHFSGLPAIRIKSSLGLENVFGETTGKLLQLSDPRQIKVELDEL